MKGCILNRMCISYDVITLAITAAVDCHTLGQVRHCKLHYNEMQFAPKYEQFLTKSSAIMLALGQSPSYHDNRNQ